MPFSSSQKFYYFFKGRIHYILYFLIFFLDARFFNLCFDWRVIALQLCCCLLYDSVNQL